MLKQTGIIALIFISFISCNSKSAFNYNEMIAAKENSLEPSIIETESNIERYISAGQFDSIIIAGEKMEQRVEAIIQELKKEPAPAAKEADNYRSAAINYFEFIKSLYTSYKKFGEASSDEEREAARDHVIKLSGETNDAIARIQEAQQKFAKANGFKIKK